MVGSRTQGSPLCGQPWAEGRHAFSVLKYAQGRLGNEPNAILHSSASPGRDLRGSSHTTGSAPLHPWLHTLAPPGPPEGTVMHNIVMFAAR